jgi:hypothetical protein
VWHKLQAAQQEIKDLSEEFQKEREDMLDTIRELNKQLKLKQLLLEAFVPLADIERLESRAIWDEDAGEWSVMRFELAGNRMRVRRPPSILTTAHEVLFGAAPMADVRAVSQYAVAQAHMDASDPRYRADNAAAFELEYPPDMTQPYAADAGRATIGAEVRAVMDAASVKAGAAKAADAPDGAAAKPVARDRERDRDRDRDAERRARREADGPAAAGGGRPDAAPVDTGKPKSRK